MLTIISVSYKSKRYLELNYELVKKLNPYTPFKWIVVQNTPEEFLKDDIQYDDLRFEVIKGPEITKHEKGCAMGASFHHAKALNIATYYTDAERLLILDPDCFILMPNWINEVTTIMSRKDLIFFGVPYTFKKERHNHHFPTAICLFVDRGLMQERGDLLLDFLPQIDGKYHEKDYFYALLRHSNSWRGLVRFFLPGMREEALEWSDFFNVMYEYIAPRLPQFFQDRNVDTGSALYKRYTEKDCYMCLEERAYDHRKKWHRALEFFLPESRRTFPRKKIHPPSFNFPSCESRIEEYGLEDKLFAIHVSGTYQPVHLKEVIKKSVQDSVEKLIKGI